MRPVAQLNEAWAVYEVGGDLAVLPSRSLRCPVCGAELLLHDFRAHCHTVPRRFCHVDAHAKCPACGLWLTFGLPCPEHLARRLMQSRYHGRVLAGELRELAPRAAEKVAERLRQWGYW